MPLKQYFSSAVSIINKKYYKRCKTLKIIESGKVTEHRTEVCRLRKEFAQFFIYMLLQHAHVVKTITAERKQVLMDGFTQAQEGL